MEEELKEKLKEFNIKEIQDSFDEYINMNYSYEFNGIRYYYQQLFDSYWRPFL